MAVATPIFIAPFTRAESSLAIAAREWERGAGRASFEADRIAGSVARARRGGTEIRSEANGVGTNRNQTRSGVNAARPGHEASLAWRARANSGGASRQISNAEANARDPGADVPRFDPSRPFRELDGSTNDIDRQARGIGRWRRVGDEFVEFVKGRRVAD